MRKLIYFSIFICGFLSTLEAQTRIPRQRGTLPAQLEETSGLILSDQGNLWSHNDSGNDPVLFEVDTTAQLLRRVTLMGASNVDWEDIARDPQGNIYVADLGNNGNARRDLKIYKVGPIPTGVLTAAVIDTIQVSYADQVAFPPNASEQHYDVESLFFAEDSLHIFTKNRSNPFDGWVYHYIAPATGGTYVLSRRGRFRVSGSQRESAWITAADISPDQKRVALLSSDNLWLFTCFEAPNYLQGFARRIDLSVLSQKEAITFLTNNRLMLTDEVFFITGGKLYDVDLTGIAPMSVSLGMDRMLAGDSVVLAPSLPPATRYTWSTGDTAPSITVRDPGTYTIEVNLRGCTARDTVVVLGPDHVETDAPLLTFTMGPNPFTQSTRMLLEIPVPGPVEVFLMDQTGKQVWQTTRLFTQPGSHTISLQPRDLAPGTYQLLLRQNGYRVSGKIIKEN